MPTSRDKSPDVSPKVMLKTVKLEPVKTRNDSLPTANGKKTNSKKPSKIKVGGQAIDERSELSNE